MYTELPTRRSVILNFQVKDPPQILCRNGNVITTEEANT
jgi:hypothetical protein